MLASVTHAQPLCPSLCGVFDSVCVRESACEFPIPYMCNVCVCTRAVGSYIWDGDERFVFAEVKPCLSTDRPGEAACFSNASRSAFPHRIQDQENHTIYWNVRGDEGWVIRLEGSLEICRDLTSLFGVIASSRVSRTLVREHGPF